MVTILIMFVVMFLFCYFSNEKIKTNLSPLLHIADSEVLACHDNASKMKLAVDLIQKKMEIDLRELLVPINHAKKRKRPKEIKMSRQMIAIVVLLSILGISIHISSIVMFSNYFQGQY